MSFNIKHFAEGDVGMASKSLRIFMYKDTVTDTVEQMAADAFFDSARHSLRVDDVIFVTGTDGSVMFIVTEINDIAPFVKTDYYNFQAQGVIAAGRETTDGGSATEVFAVTGVTAADQVVTQLIDDGTNNVSILTAITGTDQISVTFSGDPAADTIFAYHVARDVTA